MIECDGFAYHSDKEAFTRDRSRDRVFQQHGYRVFRFSGQEIYHDSVGKAHELCKYLFALHPTLLQNTDQQQEKEQQKRKRHTSKRQKKRKTGELTIKEGD